ncbi:TIGR00730 family Rossman fold protein [Opitutaceae bacterium TAV4]|nr:TIGR00730 family Rossman fold protein [Opitutaceae bacterium TAV4]RRK01219.1 TIGR00730 family Rossman fold protein [Opitutaceae bacterium TAV3]
MTKLLCVYCASSTMLASKYYEAGARLGEGLVRRGWGLVYGGGKAGVMGAVALQVKAGGGRVVGVIPDFMVERELAFREADELIVVNTMRERRRIMEERASAFVALPGGIGTLEELIEIMMARALNRIDKPLVLVNQEGFYDDLLRFFERMTRERFLSKSPGLFTVTDSVDDVWRLLEHPCPLVVDELWR